MSINDNELSLLSDTIEFCVDKVSKQKPFEAEPWIILEESIGYDRTKLLFSDSVYGQVASALDLFCHAAQHDRLNIKETSLHDLGETLLAIAKQIPRIDDLLLDEISKLN